MQNYDQTHPRIWQSALALKIYFERKLGFKLELLKDPPTVAMSGDIPLGPDLRAHGIWGLRPQAPLAATLIDEIASTFGEVLRAKQKTLDRAAGPSNVIALRPRPTKRWQIKCDCLMECSEVDELYKMALEFHSLSKRYAFLAYSDLEPQSRTHIPDLLAMGSMTLFVSDICALGVDEQEALRKLMVIRSVDRPLVMAGTSRSLSDLRQQGGMNAAFLNQVSAVYFKLSKPFREYKAQGLIQYFLDSLSHDRG